MFTKSSRKHRKDYSFLSQLKRSNVGTTELLQFYTVCIRPILEFACSAFHDSLTTYLSNDLEIVQKRVLRIMFPWVPYDEALNIAGLQQLNVRRQRLTDKLFNETVTNDSHRLHSLLPPRNMNDFSLRNKHKFNANFRTERHKKSFIVHNSLKV